MDSGHGRCLGNPLPVELHSECTCVRRPYTRPLGKRAGPSPHQSQPHASYRQTDRHAHMRAREKGHTQNYTQPTQNTYQTCTNYLPKFSVCNRIKDTLRVFKWLSGLPHSVGPTTSMPNCMAPLHCVQPLLAGDSPCLQTQKSSY